MLKTERQISLKDIDNTIVSAHAFRESSSLLLLNTFKASHGTSEIYLIDLDDSLRIVLGRSFAGRVDVQVLGDAICCASSTEEILCVFRNNGVKEIKIKKSPLVLVVGCGAVFLKQAKSVAKMNKDLTGFETVWNLERDDVKDFVVLGDSKKLLVLYSNGTCCLVGQKSVQKINSMASPWHSVSSVPPHGIMLVDAAGSVYYCEYRKGKIRVSAKPCPLPFLVDKVVALQSGFDCFFSSDGTMLGMMPHVSLSDNKTCDNFIFESNQGDCCITESPPRLYIVRKETKEITIKILDPDRFANVVDGLIQSKLFDTALHLVRRQKPIMHSLETKVVFNLAYSQICDDKDYENGMLNLSIACGDDTVKMLHVFEFLLPASLRWKPTSDNVRTIDCISEREQLSNALLPYLWSHRSRILSSPDPSAAVKTMIDTAILNCLLIMSDNTATGSVLQFLQRRDNNVDYESSRVALQKRGLYSELLQLYNIQGHHSTAMELIKKLSLDPEKVIPRPAGTSAELKGQPGAWAAVKYLSSIVNPEISLVKYHCRWMMSLDPDATVTMFQHLYPSIPTKVAVSILSQDGSLLYSAQYLEEILQIKEMDLGENSTSVWDDRQILAELYLQMLANNKTSANLLDKLTHLLDSYAHTLDLNKLRRLLSEGQYSHDAMVLVLEKLKQHKKALEILIVDLEDPAKAERYCRRVGDKKVFVDLLKVALKSQQANSNVLQILSRNISPDLVIQTLACVPDRMGIHECNEYITASIWTLKEHQKKLYMMKHLAKGKLQTICNTRMQEQCRKHIVSGEKMCPMCQKQLGASAHVCSNNQLYHYSCFTRIK
ncbi:hypothetical protein M9434_002957 [Picochlorum sp. BPE23]|nr:hypothetical protein M9434_002957 [Picochlorum sp. BPE23]